MDLFINWRVFTLNQVSLVGLYKPLTIIFGHQVQKAVHISMEVAFSIEQGTWVRVTDTAYRQVARMQRQIRWEWRACGVREFQPLHIEELSRIDLRQST